MPTVPAIKGRIGRTDYFQASISARELAEIAVPASETTGWDDLTISERFQRDVSPARVRKELLPYLAYSKDRFYGSLIVTVIDPDQFDFEPLSEALLSVPAAYRTTAEDIGFLSINGGQLVALDGQHRLVALRELITNPGDFAGPQVDKVGDDAVCVMFIKHESLESTRRIFNKVNRHARPTTLSDNIITSEDDGPAIIARWLVEHQPPLGLAGPMPPLNWSDRDGRPIVKVESQTLDQSDPKLTTLSAVYNTVDSVLAANGITGWSEKDLINRPDDDELASAYQWAAEWWTEVLGGLRPFVEARRDPSVIPQQRQYRSPNSLLFRPVGQMVLFQGLGQATRKGIGLEDAVGLANDLPWSASKARWRDIIVRRNGRMITTQKNIRLAGQLFAYFVAPDRMDEAEIEHLRYERAIEIGWEPDSGDDLPVLPRPLRRA